MSYFLFGFLDFGETRLTQEARTRVIAIADRNAIVADVCAKVSDPSEPSLLSEMRGPYSQENSLPFLLVKTKNDDNSESILSPFPGGIRDSVGSVSAVAGWFANMFAANEGITQIRVWFSDGFDVDFERHTSHLDKFVSLYEQKLIEKKDVPSIVVSIIH